MLAHLDSGTWQESDGGVDSSSSSRTFCSSQPNDSSAKSCLRFPRSTGLLPTAIVRISKDGRSIGVACRALLDTGSEINIISSRLSLAAGLPMTPTDRMIAGVGGLTQTVPGISSLYLHTREGRRLPVEAHVVDQVTDQLPSSGFSVSRWKHITKMGGKLADPSFNKRATIDLLVGVELFMQLVQHKTIPPVGNSPWLLSSEVGWLVLGHNPRENARRVQFNPVPESQIFRSYEPAIAVRQRRSVVSAEPGILPSILPCPEWIRSYNIYRTHALKDVIRTLRRVVQLSKIRSLDHSLNPFSSYVMYRARALEGVVQALRSVFQPASPVGPDQISSPKRRLKTSRELVRNLFSVVPPLNECQPSVSLFHMASCSQTVVDHLCVSPAKVCFSEGASPNKSSVVSSPVMQETDQLLRRLFEIEEIDDVSPWTPAELEAEQLFVSNAHRGQDGRYVVPLPFVQDRSILGASRSIALRQLYRLETKLRKDPDLAQAYQKFIHEYMDLGHMRKVEPPAKDLAHYYLPHHAVRRPGDPLDKIRVVFNASQRTSNGLALNEILHVGPKLQQDICEVVLRFRSFRFVFIADIRQMFRQIRHPVSDQDMLRIVWRDSPLKDVEDFALCTVTYGTASAPFLANRVLRHLAETSEERYPIAAGIIFNNTYVDDVHGGGESVESAVEARDELIELLATAGLELRKWATNHPHVLQGVPDEYCLSHAEAVDLDSDDDKPLRLLGVAWNPRTDCFFFKVPTTPHVRTKRELASQVGRIYDPAGWVMPVSVFARCIQREVCHAKYEWDTPLPTSLVHDWAKMASSMDQLAKIQLPRHISTISTCQWLVGFSDASERAYAAVIYHVSHHESAFVTRLVIARARIAPLKQETIPRLELLAAELLGKTMRKVRSQFAQVPSSHIVACSDSSVVLSWLTADPAPLWKVFVGNRVAKTLSNIPAEHWFHVRTGDNPADVASRGALPNQLVQNSLWWEGPLWFKLQRAQWPIRRVRPDLGLEPVAGEIRTVKVQAAVAVSENQLENDFSSFSRLRRVVAWLQRFASNCRSRQERSVRRTLIPLTAQIAPLSTSELKAADLILVKRAQKRHFGDIIAALSQNAIPHTKLMKQLALFRSDDGLVRVGGRLAHSSASYETQHPALLAPKDALTLLIVRQAHENCLHVGPRATLAHLRTRFWIIDGRSVVSKCLSGCKRCFSIHPRPFQPEMGQLPAGRVQRTFTFDQVGVDFAGPFAVSVAGLRGTRVLEIYLAVFVCFATKAVHLEAVMDLSTDGFLQCLERFIGRRGVPSVIWSDNGRNFLGSANLLRKIRIALESGASQEIMESLAARGIEWKFIPPRAPHFGGLWEAAIKSAKRLIKVNLRGHTVTYQTFSTIIVRVEAVLNSRPLVYQSSSPDDILVLTPGHFLVQRPLTALPESIASPNVSSRLVPKWNFVNQTMNSFWKKWSREYLLELQTKAKWNTPARQPCEGDVVLINEDNRPPLSWPMGVIVELILGTDGVARVAKVRSSTGELVRPLVKLCPLPQEHTVE